MEIGTPGARNVISGNTAAGVRISGSASRDNQVGGNYIGVDVTGTVAQSNAEGVRIESSAARNKIGASSPDLFVTSFDSDEILRKRLSGPSPTVDSFHAIIFNYLLDRTVS